MSGKNPSTMLAESLADFSKAANQAFTEFERKTRQDIAHAIAETHEARSERDQAMQDLASSKAALAKAELTIATQAENLVNQLETITQLRRELNQWKDQARNWQEHFLRVEQERCAQLSRIDELIIDRLEKFDYTARPGTSANAFTPKTPKQLASSISTRHPVSPRPTQPPAHRPSAELSSPEEAPNGTLVQNNANGYINLPPPTPESGSRRPKPKSHVAQPRERATLPGTSERPSHRKPRKINDNNQATGTDSVHSQSQQQSNTRTSTVIRRVQAVVNVKSEDDDVDQSGEPDRSSPPPAAVTDTTVKRDDSQGIERSRRRLSNKRGTALVSEDEAWSQEEENKGVEGSAYKLRKTSRINYREEVNDEEDDELMMGAEEAQDEKYAARPIDESRQQAAPPRKRRKYVPR